MDKIDFIEYLVKNHKEDNIKMNKDEFIKYCIKRVLDKTHYNILLILSLKDAMNKGDRILTQTKIAKELNISMPLMSYYINGNKRTMGLFELGLIQFITSKSGHHIGIKITESGKEILKVMK